MCNGNLDGFLGKAFLWLQRCLATSTMTAGRQEAIETILEKQT